MRHHNQAQAPSTTFSCSKTVKILDSWISWTHIRRQWRATSSLQFLRTETRNWTEPCLRIELQRLPWRVYSLTHGICLYRIPSYLLTDNGTQYVSNFIGNMCIRLKTKQMSTTLYHPCTNVHIKRYNRTMVTRLLQYVATHRRNLILFPQFLTFAYST